MNLAVAVVVTVLTITTQNVRAGMPPERVRHDVHQAAEQSSVVFTQEMFYRRAAAFAPSGWGTAHHAGNRKGDCATYWDRSRWRERRSFVTLLTNAPFHTGLKYALTTVLHLRGHPRVTMAAVCVHMMTRSIPRRAWYARGMDRLRDLLSRLDRYPYVVVGGDWNRGWPQRARIAGYDSKKPPEATGGQGGRIDYFWWQRLNIDYRSIRVIGHTFSDHNGTRMSLALRGTTMRR